MAIDFNADLGEGYEGDERLMPYLDSCSIACGGHYGNASTITTAIHLARTENVKVGAHPSYPDLLNFGRQSMTMSLKAFQASLEKQLDLFFNTLEKQSVHCHHIKAHGALYSDLLSDQELAGAYLEILSNYPCTLLYAMPHKAFSRAAEAYYFKLYSEGFLDRRYNEQGYLMSRQSNNAQIENTSEIVAQLNELSTMQRIPYLSNSGTKEYLPAKIQTVCLHSDHPKAIERAQAIRKAISKSSN